MKKLFGNPKSLLLVAGMASLISIPTIADNSGLTITPGFGYTDFDGDRGDDLGNAARSLDDTLGSLGIGYRFDNSWQIELVYGQGELAGRAGDVDYSTVHLDGLYHLTDDGTVVPYLAFGAGYSEFDELSQHETSLNLGGGLKFHVNDVFSVRTDVRGIRELDDDYFDIAMNLGLQFLIGGKSEPAPAPEPVAVDSDGDGVVDENDRCPGTAAGVEVDANGCELDSDGDGVVNSKDECPDTEAGARVDEVGCYIILTESRSIRLEIKFANNSSTVEDSYLGKIEEVAQFMREYPKTNVVIEGHTDDRGKASYNLLLSEKRAKNVASVLVSRFNVDPARVSSVGYGESKPVADNSTLDGRAENRRVVAVMSASVQKRAE